MRSRLPGRGSSPPLRLATLLLLLFCSASLFASVSAQEPEPSSVYEITGDEMLRNRQGEIIVMTLINPVLTSDSLTITANRGESRENERLGTAQVNLYTDVRIIEGSTTITGDTGHYNRELEIAKVNGNVRIIDGETDITCLEAVYNRSIQKITLSGDVVILRPGKRIEAQKIIYDRPTGHAEAFVDVAAYDLEDDSVLRGQHGSFDREAESAVMDDSPRLTRVEAPGDTVRVEARIMRETRARNLVEAMGDVHYTRGDTEAFADSAAFFQDRDYLVVMGEPRVLQKGGELLGDTLKLYFVGNELRRMEIEGAARFLDSPADQRVFPGRRSEISGEYFRIRFEDGDIRQVEVRGNPKSIYIPAVDYRASINEAEGDSMLIGFSGGDVEEVKIFGSATGRYRYLDNWREALAVARPDSAPGDSLAAGLDAGVPSAGAAEPDAGVPPAGEAGVDGEGEAQAAAGPTRFDELAEEINYEARDIVYKAEAERVYLEGMARVQNPDFILQAKSIRFDSREDFLDARGEPVLIDSADKLYGELMEYSISEKAGVVYGGATRYGEGFYSGEKLKKLGKNTVNVSHSIYTTCDLAEPHFHFKIDRIQVKTGDKMVGAPVRFYLGKIPLLYLPFIFNNLDRGRRSGFIQPDFEFGITTSGSKPQRFIRDIGYYLAISDYADLQSRFDFVEQRSIYGALSFRYYRRYFMSGSIRNNLSWSVSRDLQSDTRSWGLQGSHNQNFGEHSRLNARVDYVSSSSMRDDINHYSVDEVIDQRLNSNVSFSRRWDNVSLSGSYSRTQILNYDATDDSDDLLLREKIPLSISTTSIPLWPSGVGKGGLQGMLSRVKLQPKLNYSRSIDNYENRREVSETASTGSSMGFNWKLGFIQLAPSVSATENWTRSNTLVSETVAAPFGKLDESDLYVPISPFGESGLLGSTVTEAEKGSEWSHRWSAKASASMKFYGLFYPRIGNLRGMRHSISPRVSWTYSESRGSRFSLSRSLSMSLSNVLDLKFGEGDNVTRKSGILSWDMRTSYDLDKGPDENPWGSLSSSLRLSPFNAFSLSYNYSHDLNENRKLSASINGNLGIGGRFDYGEIKKVERRQNVVSAREAGDTPAEEEAVEPESPEFSGWGDGGHSPGGAGAPGQGGAGRRDGRGDGRSQTWNMGMSFSLNQTANASPSPTISLNGRISLTENWKAEYRTSLNMDDGSLRGQTISLTRDLHCWEATFSRLVINDVEQYYFRIFLKAHPDDIKLESGDRSAGYRF